MPAAGQAWHCHCETLVNYEEMKGADLCSLENVELIHSLTAWQNRSGGFSQCRGLNVRENWVCTIKRIQLWGCTIKRMLLCFIPSKG